MLIVAGDWNAMTGPVDTETRHILGKFAVGTRCANGDRLVNVASAKSLVVSSTRFQHPQRHLVTWFYNDGRTRNQIDHMLVRSHWASSVVDCRAYNGAQTGSEHGSDHAMVRSRQLRNNRAPREDGIPAEVNKTCLDSLGSWLHRVFSKVWLCEPVPNTWSEAVLLPLLKKGDNRICSNWLALSHSLSAKVNCSSVLIIKPVGLCPSPSPT